MYVWYDWGYEQELVNEIEIMIINWLMWIAWCNWGCCLIGTTNDDVIIIECDEIWIRHLYWLLD